MQIEATTQTAEYKDMLQGLIDEATRLALLKAVRTLLIYDAPLWCIALLEQMAREYEV